MISAINDTLEMSMLKYKTQAETSVNRFHDTSKAISTLLINGIVYAVERHKQPMLISNTTAGRHMAVKADFATVT